MPCYRCGTRQTDPELGASPWGRGVKAGRQILVCPGCQSDTGWQDDLDRCPACGGVRLVRRLGEVECRECGEIDGAVSPGDPAGSAGASGSEGGNDPDAMTAELEREIEQALRRVLGRPRAEPAR